MPKQKIPSRKVSIDLPLDIWARYEELGHQYGLKIKDFVLGAFEAIDFFDKFLSESLSEDQLYSISPLLRQQIEKFEALYCGKYRSRNLDKPNVIYFDAHNDLRPDQDLNIRTHDIVQDFESQDKLALDIIKKDRKRHTPELIIR
ncbi:MAG: hypothetical protein ACTSVU_06345 [Promethearchaeota archaeon]